MNQQHPNQPFRPGLDSQGFPLKPKKKHKVRNVLLVIGAGFVVMVGGCTAIVAGSGTDAARQAGDPLPNVVKTTAAPKPAATKPAAPATTEAPAPTTEPETTEPEVPSMTNSQEQAVGSAESYLSFTAFSRKGLIRQLSSSAGEGFSVADATYAVDHIKVNWNEQAAKSAQSYLKMTHFSRKGLIRQLESSAGEGFTHAQAVYGVTKAGL
jgi:hypothetical protein